MELAKIGTNEWAAIEQQVRQCFVQEDAPEHLASLEKHLLALHEGISQGIDTNTEQWRSLTRSIHTLKGSAGLSQLHNLSTLAHRLEDVLLALGDRRLPDPELAMEVLLVGVDEMAQHLKFVAETDRDCEPSPLLENIDLLLSQAESREVSQTFDSSLSGLVSTVLETDFLNCLERTRKAIGQDPAALNSALTYLIQDCQTLGEILQLDWLLAAVSDLEQLRNQSPETQTTALQFQLDRLEECRQQTLTMPDPVPLAVSLPVQGEAVPDEMVPDETVQDEAIVPSPLPLSQITPPTPQTAFATKPLPTVSGATVSGTTSSASPEPVATMRVPVRQLDRLANTVGDLLIQSERVDLDQRRLRSASQGLKKQTRQFYQLRERIQNCYDELLLPGARFPKFKSIGAQAALGNKIGGSNLGVSRGGEEIPSLQVLGLEAPVTGTDEFDPLELDRFTDLHTLLQDLQEFLARIDEYADDIGLYVQSAQESHDRLKQELGTLREGLTEARMVPFVSLADRFRRALWDLNQRYNKQVKFVVQGGETEIDRAILDALYDPLLHLIRNAFDHGQESPSDRQKQGKSPQGKVILKATHSGTTVIITVTDDGRGIDLAKVKTIAERKGLLSSPNPSPQECLNCLFVPGFSTATQAGELSGRGVGLDVVKGQVENLRGSVQVQTRQGKGTRFTLRIPSSLNILPLLLCQQYRENSPPAQVAIPSSEVLEIVELSALGSWI